MGRLTDRTENGLICLNNDCKLSNPLLFAMEKLAEFEDFVEEQGFESLDELKSKLNKKFYIYNDDVRQGKVFNGVFFSYEQLMVMDEWAEFNTDYFKKYLDSQKENQALKAKIQELELAELIRRKEK